MDNVFFILMFVSFITLIVGMVRPSAVSRLVRKQLNRKRIGLIFGGTTLASMILFGMTTNPSTTNTNTRNSNSTAQAPDVNSVTNNANTVANTAEQENTNATPTTNTTVSIVNQSEEPTNSAVVEEIVANTNTAPQVNTNTDTTVPRQQAIQAAIEKAIGAKTNMGKPRVRLVKVLAYASNVRIELNGSENFTNKMTLEGINSDTLKAYQATFATDATPNLIVAIDMYYPGSDKYGNTSDSLAVQSKLTSDTANKIQWDNVLFENIPKILDYYDEVMKF
ncbi:MAG: hypothetical protein V1685_03450 [Parcubacteria group bacterium]